MRRYGRYDPTWAEATGSSCPPCPARMEAAEFRAMEYLQADSFAAPEGLS